MKYNRQRSIVSFVIMRKFLKAGKLSILNQSQTYLHSVSCLMPTNYPRAFFQKATPYKLLKVSEILDVEIVSNPHLLEDSILVSIF